MSGAAALDDALRQGHYAAKQIFCRDRLIAWTHRRRFETALDLARPFHGQRLLDYGCGDGTFLAMLQASGSPAAYAAGAELDDDQVSDCRQRLGTARTLEFFPIADLDGPPHRDAYDVVVCMEVLEHVVALDVVIDRLWRLLRTGGTLIVSVPVETGLPLFVKQAARRIAGWRGIGQYRDTSGYSLREYLASAFAGSRQHMERPVYQGVAMPFHDHKGFNWMALRNRLQRRFEVERTLASPVRWMGPHLASQVWFVGRKACPAPRGAHE